MKLNETKCQFNRFMCIYVSVGMVSDCGSFILWMVPWCSINDSNAFPRLSRSLFFDKDQICEVKMAVVSYQLSICYIF
ncbi:hypothetical protein OGO_01731 [Enterococcus faecium EnGen0015]|nr:hypothetical protein OGO_01731 [Enterococcus faecium EnGen0015]